MKKFRLATLVILAMTLVVVGCSSAPKEDTIVIGAKDFTEQDIMGNILSIMIDRNTDLKSDYKNGMGSNVLFAAMQSGDLDVCVDYTGTIYGNYLSYSEMKSADEVLQIARDEVGEKFRLRVLDPIGFNNTYCIAVRPETAEQYNLKTYSDLAKVSSDMVFGGTFEVLNRNDGIPNLKKVYNMSFKEEVAVDGVLRYTAIQNDETQVTEVFSTDGMIMEYGLVVLEDDLSFFPPYHAVPLIREDTAEKYPQLVAELEKLTGLINDDMMRELNYKVDVLKEDARVVAETFLKEQGIIS